MTTAIGDAAGVEIRRLTRTGLLLGLLVTFAFFGLAGPALALYMPQILGAAAGTEQLTIEAAEATPADGIAFYDQSAMQLGLIFAIAVAVTALGWDARTGSSIFYRTRVQRLASVLLPRLAVDAAAAVVGYSIGFLLAVVLTSITIGAVAAGSALALWISSTVYLLMAMSIGHLLMAAMRRTAAAIAVTTVVVLLLPVLSQVGAVAAWMPTSLLGSSTILVWPLVSAVVVAAACVAGATVVAGRQTLRRDT
ncbi:hypothetical protein [Gordonia caeni]|uniref:ABC transporter n=1 Tax=Gordonia caeni TaxID=1007097 RepID=A0ABP7PJ59_9ACTN